MLQKDAIQLLESHVPATYDTDNAPPEVIYEPRDSNQDAIPSVAPRGYIYVLKLDVGMAPCVEKGMWSLALCKAKIRNGARVGDYVVGLVSASTFGSKGLIQFIAKITSTMAVHEYHSKRMTAQHRSDMIYTCEGQDLMHCGDTLYHSIHEMNPEGEKQQGWDREGTVLLSTTFVSATRTDPLVPASTYMLPTIHTQGHKKHALSATDVAELDSMIRDPCKYRPYQTNNSR